jgi:hypothetical protein
VGICDAHPCLLVSGVVNRSPAGTLGDELH